jgi:hypothetical protein
MDAHGGWVATPIDLVRVTLRADGFPTVPDVLTAGTLTTMTTPTTALTPDGKPAGYAMGWQVNVIPQLVAHRLPARYDLPPGAHR